MKRIETRLAAVLGRPARRLDKAKPVNFTPLIDPAILSAAERQAAKDGLTYLRDLVQILLGLYGSGRLQAPLAQSIRKQIASWSARSTTRDKPLILTKRNFKLERVHYERALRRWRADAPPEAESATAMCVFLLESYGVGELQIALQAGDVAG